MPEATRHDIKELFELRDRSIRYERRQFVIGGKKLVAEAIASGLAIQDIFVTELFASKEADYLAGLKGLPLLTIPQEAGDRLAGTTTFPGILAVVSMPEVTTKADGRLLAALDGVNDPGNLGTMIRTAEWFGVTTLILGPGTVDPYNEKVVRSAMGSLFRSRFVQTDNLAKTLIELKAEGYRLVAAEISGGGEEVLTADPTCLLMGSESHGLSPDLSALADAVYTIPGAGTTESLNVAVSFGIILHQLSHTYGRSS